MPAPLKSQLLKPHADLEPILRGDATLVRGARGPTIRAIQDGLVALGYGLPGGPDGVFGKATEVGLGELRRLHERVGAAIVDAETLTILDDALARLDAVADYSLRNARFADDAALAAVLRGERPLPRSGETVKAIQRALLDLHFSLPRGGADGDYGDETREALRRFQRWQRVRPGGELSPLTMMVLDELAPPPNVTVTRAPEYAKLLRDDRLTVTIGMGYDEKDLDVRERGEVVRGLLRSGFVQIGETADDAVHTFIRDLEIPGRRGTMRVRLVSRDTARPEACFAEGLVQDAVTVYAGHARYGTGPDFDDKESAAGNFVIGVGAPQHLSGALERGYNPHMNQILAGVPNDLLRHRFDPERYQLWAFLGCTTRNYLDELRGLIAGKDTHNLDLIVSTRLIYWSNTAFGPLTIVRGLLTGADIDALLGPINERALATERKLGKEAPGLPFIGDGFGDNAPR
ncbi:MAG: peptidoglycan-binding domain-containing protein [Nannocystaceae bacterium]